MVCIRYWINDRIMNSFSERMQGFQNFWIIIVSLTYKQIARLIMEKQKKITNSLCNNYPKSAISGIITLYET